MSVTIHQPINIAYHLTRLDSSDMKDTQHAKGSSKEEARANYGMV
jgi:hypothetical protein